jgi:hypothetical protein
MLTGPESTRSIRQTFFDVDLRSDGIVWLKRTIVPYASLVEVNRAYDEFLAVVDPWLADRSPRSGVVRAGDPPPMGWLYDLRAASAQRNDPEFEAVIQARRSDLLARTPLLVVLVKTAAGRLQLNRLAAPNRAQLQVSDDVEASIAWLRRELGVDVASVRAPRVGG